MAINANADKVQTEAEQLLKVWKNHPDLKFGDELILQSFADDTDGLGGVMESLSTKEDELAALRIARDNRAARLSESCSRVRSGIRAVFGPNSSEYEQAGGTRTSDRKRSPRKAGEPASSKAVPA